MRFVSRLKCFWNLFFISKFIHSSRIGSIFSSHWTSVIENISLNQRFQMNSRCMLT